MIRIERDPELDIVAASGVLRVTVHRRFPWFTLLFEIAVILILATFAYRGWAKMSILFHVIWVWGLISAAIAFVYQLSGQEVIEFDTQKLTVSKEIHGWERKREFRIEDCTELQWMGGSKNLPQGLQCKIGRKTLRFGEFLSEQQAIEILTALQRALPNVAQKVCSYPDSMNHFITLGLS